MVAVRVVASLLLAALLNIWCSSATPPHPHAPAPATCPPAFAPADCLVCPLQLTPLSLAPPPPTGPSPRSAPSSSPRPVDPLFTMPSSIAPAITLPASLSNSPRLTLSAWLKAVLAHARQIEPTLDLYGSLYLVAPDLTWQKLPKNLIPAPGPDIDDGSDVEYVGTIRPRPSHICPPPRTLQ